MEEVKEFLLDGCDGRSVKIEEIAARAEPSPDRGCEPGTVRPPALSFREQRRICEEILREERELRSKWSFKKSRKGGSNDGTGWRTKN